MPNFENTNRKEFTNTSLINLSTHTYISAIRTNDDKPSSKSAGNPFVSKVGENNLTWTTDKTLEELPWFSKQYQPPWYWLKSNQWINIFN